MTDNYTLHYHVQQLLDHFHIGKAIDHAENFVAALEKSLNSPRSAELQATYSNVHSDLRSRCAHPQEFDALFHDLKNKNPHELKALLLLLGDLHKDKALLTVLRDHAVHGALSRGEQYMDLDGIVSALRRASLSSQKPSIGIAVPTKQQLAAVISGNEARRVNGLSLPPEPSWSQRRPMLSFCFLANRDDQMSTAQPNVSSLPFGDQEDLVTEELLYCLQGVEGVNIRLLPAAQGGGTMHFVVNSSLDPAIRELCHRILPLAVAFQTVAKFTEDRSRFRYGMVCHALCAAMRSVLEEYFLLVAQMEQQFRNGQLSLQRLWLYTQQIRKRMQFMASVCTTIVTNELVGGAVLSLLDGKATDYLGDTATRDLCVHLTQRAAQPYFDMLERWLCTGQVLDPYMEFMIAVLPSEEGKDNLAKNRFSRWEERYQVRSEMVPTILHAVRDKILKCGLYLNVMSSCGHHVAVKLPRNFAYEPNGQSCSDVVDELYSTAGHALLDLLLREFSLLDRFRSLKHYFLLDRSDFLLQFIEVADDELHKDVDDILPYRLENLLDLAVRTSCGSVSRDPFKEDLRAALVPYSLKSFLLTVTAIQGTEKRSMAEPTLDQFRQEKLTGVEAFTFTYDVNWPLNLVFNEKVMTQYQMIFRMLFLFKQVEHELCRHWVDSKKVSELQTCGVRQRMLSFVVSYLYYATVEVVEPAWVTFFESINTAATVDDVQREHENFLDTCTKDCMLTHADVVNTLHEITALALCFASGQTTDIAACEARFVELLWSLLSVIRQISDSQRERNLCTFTQRLMDLRHGLGDATSYA